MSDPPRRGAGGLKFLPKNATRRSQADREAFDRAEEARRIQVTADRAATAASASPATRSRGRGARGRHGRTGRGDAAAGPLSGHSAVEARRGTSEGGRSRGGHSGPSGRSRGGSGGGGGGGGGGGSSSTGSKGRGQAKDEGEETETPRAAGGKKVKKEPADVMVHVGEEGKLRNIDQLALSSDEDENASGDGGANEGDEDDDVIFVRQQLLPLRLPRHDHVDRLVGINTTASSSRAAHLRQRDGAATDPTKAEDTDMPDADQAAGAAEKDADEDVAPKAAATLTGADVDDEFDDEQERLEHEIDLQKQLRMADVFFADPPATAEADAAKPAADLNGKVFLFQLPPFMPDLVSPTPASTPPPAPPAPKARAAKGKGRARAAPPADTAAEAPAPADEDNSREGMRARGGNLRTGAVPQGRAGTFKVWPDGRAALEWGGVAFEVRVGRRADWPQEVVLADGRGEQTQDGEGVATDAYGMGEVEEKFVVAYGFGEP